MLGKFSSDIKGKKFNGDSNLGGFQDLDITRHNSLDLILVVALLQEED